MKRRVDDEGRFQALTEVIAASGADQFAIDAERNRARFFRDHDNDGIGFLRETDPRAVSQSDRAIAEFFWAHGKNTCGTGDAVLGNDHTAIVEGSFGIEHSHREFRRENGIQLDARIEILTKADAAFDGKECADAFLRQSDHGIGKRFQKGEFAIVRKKEQTAAAELSQSIAQFWLENHNQSQSQSGGGAGDDPADDLERKQLRNQSEKDQNCRQSNKNPRAPSRSEGAENLIDGKSEN